MLTQSGQNIIIIIIISFCLTCRFLLIISLEFQYSAVDVGGLSVELGTNHYALLEKLDRAVFRDDLSHIVNLGSIIVADARNVSIDVFVLSSGSSSAVSVQESSELHLQYGASLGEGTQVSLCQSRLVLEQFGADLSTAVVSDACIGEGSVSILELRKSSSTHVLGGDISGLRLLVTDAARATVVSTPLHALDSVVVEAGATLDFSDGAVGSLVAHSLLVTGGGQVTGAVLEVVCAGGTVTVDAASRVTASGRGRGGPGPASTLLFAGGGSYGGVGGSSDSNTATHTSLAYGSAALPNSPGMDGGASLLRTSFLPRTIYTISLTMLLSLFPLLYCVSFVCVCSGWYPGRPGWWYCAHISRSCGSGGRDIR